MGRRLRILAISTGWPVPADTGGRQRLKALLEALVPAGEVHFLHLETGLGAHVTSCASSTGVTSVLHCPVRTRSRIRKLVSWLTNTDPLALCSHDVHAAVEWIKTHGNEYDVLWTYGPLAAYVARGVDATKTIVDFPDLPHEVQAQQCQAAATRVTRWIARMDIARWKSFEKQIASECLAVTVCSPRERAQFQRPSRVEVVPNGYTDVTPRGAITVHNPPRLLFAASPSWPPNVEGAKFLIDEVLPYIVSALPNVEVALTGSYEFLAARKDLHSLRMLGYVTDMEGQLAMADVIVVPLRSGTGTRLKVLEGWAHRIPVVSTSKGVEGIPAQSNVHLLVEDDPKSFAIACVRALTDLQLRAHLTEEAHALFLDAYSWSRIGCRFRQLIEEVTSGEDRSGKVPTASKWR